MDDLGLVEAVARLGESIVIAIADAADTELGQVSCEHAQPRSCTGAEPVRACHRCRPPPAEPWSKPHAALSCCTAACR